MTQTETNAQATAPLISLRRSFQMRPAGVATLGTGMWLAVGLFALLEHAQLLAGGHTGWAYLVMALLLLPTLLAFVELRSWAGYTGGSYRLIRSLERNDLTFFAGWIYLLGWASVSALLARIFADYGVRLLSAVTPLRLDPVWLIAALLGFFVITNVIHLRPSWRVAIWLAFAVVAFTLVLVVMLAGRVLADPARVIAPVTSRGQSFFGTVVILIGSMWVIELLTGAGDRRRRTLWIEVVLLVGGPILAGLVALGGRWGAPGAGSFEGIAEMLLPQYGQILVLVLGTVVTGVTWQVLGLLMLRRFQLIGLDGWLPAWLLRPYTFLKAPILLIIAQIGLTLAALLLGPALTSLPGSRVTVTLNLAAIAGLAYLLLGMGVDIADILLANSPRAAERTLRLPLYPAIPAASAGINLLLMLAVPWSVLVLGAAWLLLGALIYWRSGREQMRSSRLGVTVFQDVRTGAGLKSHYPVLVPVANPSTALGLARVGAALARVHEGHVSVLQVVQVADQQPLESGRLHARERQTLLERVLDETGDYGVPTEGVTRLARSVAQGIMDTVSEETPRAIVMGWNARRGGDGRRELGHIVDRVLQGAATNVVIVRGDWIDAPLRVLVPVGGGPHAAVAARIALDLTEENGGSVTLLHVVDDPEAATGAGLELVRRLHETLGSPERAEARVVMADSTRKGILKALETHDAVLLGATEQNIFDTELFGQLPLEIAAATDKPLALVRSATGLTDLVARRAWSSISDTLPTLTAQEQLETYYRMRKAAQPSINFFILIGSSAVIATLGLLLNSAAVIIGAMLVAPLMSPFIALATGIVTGDIQTMRNALTSIFQGVLLAIFIAIVSTLVSPLVSLTPEVMSRTQPNLLDLMVALASGFAGAYAIARKEVGEALPGVAIAAALMPPLCSVGIGIALGNLSVAVGAFLLFITNLVAIVFAAAIVFLLLGMRPPARPERRRWLRQGLVISLISLALVSIPLGIVLYRAVQQGQVETQTRSIVTQRILEVDENAELANFEIELGWREVAVLGTLYIDSPVPEGWVDELDATLERTLDRDVSIRLFIIEGQVLQTGEP